MKYFFLVLLAFTAFPTAADAVWFDSAWDYRFKVEIVNTKVGSSTVTNFPVYFDLAGAPTGFWTNAQADGDDIRVVESDEVTETAFELVSIATTTKRGELHFLADGPLATTSTSSFWIYYGNPSASAYATTSTYGRNNVWTEYDGVWHMNDNTNSAGSATTITGTDTSMTYSNATATISKAGQFNGSTSRIEFSRTSIPISNNPYTVSAWAYQNTQQNNNREIVSQWTPGTSGNAYFLGTAANTTVRVTDALNRTSTWSATAWHYINSVNLSNNHHYYQDSVLRITKGSAMTYTGAQALVFGRQGSLDGEYWNGAIDEVRIRHTAVSQSWIVTEYNNQSSTSTFFRIGAEETEPVVGGAAPVNDIIWFQ